jgi:hypothetical protein
MVVLGVLACVLTVGAFATPAFAKAKTYLPRTVRVGAVSATGSGTLTYLRSGHKVGMSKQYVKLYRWTKVKGHWKWVYRSRSKTTSVGVFFVKLPAGYKYRLYYAGDRTRRAVWSATLVRSVVLEPTSLSITDVSYLVDGVTSSVSGELVDAFAPNAPIAGVSLAVKQGSLEAGTVTTAADGTWELTGLPVGDYVAVYAGDALRAGSSRAFSVTYPIALSAISGISGPYSVDPGGTTVEVSGALISDLASGDVDEETWAPVPGVTVVVRAAGSGAQVTSVTTDADGEWTASLPAGDYVVGYEGSADVSVSGSHYFMAPCSCPFTISNLPFADAFIEPVSFEFELAPGATKTTVSGTITLQRDGLADIPMPGFSVKILSWDVEAEEWSLYLTRVSDGSGVWSASLPEGEYSIESEAMADYEATDSNHYNLNPGASWESVMVYAP